LRIKLGSGLIPQNILIIFLIIIIVFAPSVAVRIIFGLPFVLFFPGYSLILALFPKKDRMGNIERVALSFGLSIAVVPLIGLILNYTSWGITLYSTLYSVAGFIFAMSLVAWLRLRSLDKSERFSIEFEINRPTWSGNKWDKALSLILVAAILGAVGVLGYVVANPKVGEKFTEFYILGPEGVAADYPTDISIGEEAVVILGIVNNEQGTIDYRVEIIVDGTKSNEINPINLENEGTWEELVTFPANHLGNDQKVEFLLYRDGQSEVYRSIHLWVDVR
jgi:uncharacterized membrane protein